MHFYHHKCPLRQYIKNPVVAEFMGFRNDSKFDESELEQALIDNLQQFIMELDRGFAFVERQKHIKTTTQPLLAQSTLAKVLEYFKQSTMVLCLKYSQPAI